MCDSKGIVVSIGCLVISAIIVGIVLLATSFSKLEAYEVGLEYNPNMISIND